MHEAKKKWFGSSITQCPLVYNMIGTLIWRKVKVQSSTPLQTGLKLGHKMLSVLGSIICRCTCSNNHCLRNGSKVVVTKPMYVDCILCGGFLLPEGIHTGKR